MYSFNKLPHYNDNRELVGLQILKFICSIFVVQIHTYSIMGKFLLPLCRIAVPIFFIISGYFMVSNKGTISSGKLIKIAIKIIKITIIAYSSYILFDILIRLLINSNLEPYSRASYWMYEFLFRTPVGGHLWYLTSYLQTLLFMYVLMRIKKFHLLFLIIPMGIIINLLIGCYSFIFFEESNPLSLSRNALTIAIPCVAIGVIIRIYEDYLPSQKIIFISLIASIIILYIEHIMIRHYIGDIIIMTLPVAILTFVLFLRSNFVWNKCKYIGLLGKRHSMNIYLWHPMIATIYSYFPIYRHINPGIQTIIVAIITLGISIIASQISLPNKCVKFVRNIISN